MNRKPIPNSNRQAVLRSLSERVPKQLEPLLDRLFTSCQTRFFELASAARNNAERQRYLDLLRDLKRHRSALTDDFQSRISAAFARLDGPAAAGSAGSTGPGGATPAAQDASGKQQVTVAMVRSARKAWRRELQAVQERLQIVASVPFAEHENPLDPGCIASAFVAACAVISQDKAILKLLCAQFDTNVLQGLEPVLQAASQVLADVPVDAGESAADPSEWLDASFRGGAATADPSGMAPVSGADPARDLQEISVLLQRLRATSALPLASLPPGAAALQGGAPASPATAPAPMLSGDQLVALISDLQSRPAWRGAGESQASDIRGVIKAIAASKGSLHMGQADQDMVDIVAMFFDLVTEDRDLPLSIQALLSRLQLPVLKIALLDRTFFTDRTHPARQLIDAIARVGVGWDANSKQEQDALLAHLNTLLEELLGHPALGVEAFKLALLKLNEHMARVEQRALKQERRSAEKAQAEARTAAAREAVHEVLRERLDGRDLPEPLLEFFTIDWQRVLQLVFLRKGQATADWNDAVQLVDELMQAADAPSHADETALADLFRRLELGLDLTQSHTGEAQARVNTLRELHRARATATTAQEAAAAPVVVTRVKIEEPPSIPPRASRADTAPSSGDTLTIESLQRVDAIPIGTWFEYEVNSVTRRCKLSARIDETRMFLFCDRMGLPVGEKPRKVFALELQQGQVRMIEDAPLVDRTMGRIAAALRERAGEG